MIIREMEEWKVQNLKIFLLMAEYLRSEIKLHKQPRVMAYITHG